VRVIQSVAFSLFITLALAAAAGGLAFVAGRQTADGPAQFDRGAAEGERLGRSLVRADYAPGASAYNEIFNRGLRRGYVRGRREGRLLGQQRGRAAAHDAPFAGFPGGWSIGSWYLINIAPGQKGARYAIGGRTLARPDAWYGVCAGGARICVRASLTRRVSRARATARVVPEAR
jgi:hypothetical protein